MLPAVFVDRDGVIIEEVGHLTRVEQLRLLPGVPRALRTLNDMGTPVVVVSNQSAVGRGLCSEETLGQIHAALAEMLQVEEAHFEGFYYCPHHPREGKGRYRLECECRKPKPGMIRQAAQDFDLDLHGSVVVGDSITDLEAGWQMGCQTVLVLTGHGRETRDRLAVTPRQPDHIALDFGAAIDWILRHLGAPKSP